jgi:TolB-like protein/Flp pilus assembly protein TadD
MIGEHLGHFRITAKIGSGGMGEVYRARDEQLHRDVAIKVLSAPAVSSPGSRSRLIREARAASHLNHPNICTVYEVGESDGHSYIAMELVEGQPLSERLVHGPLSPQQVTHLGSQLADALAHAHGRGVVHADLKSANIVVTPEGRAKVLDFGLAKRLTAAELAESTTQGTCTQVTFTAPGRIAGTLAYMAPEQLRGEMATERSDVWSLGVVLYEMAAGARPFHGQTPFELTSAVLNDAPRPLDTAVPVPLRAVIERCLDKEPARRFRNGGEVGATLDALEKGTAVARVALRHRPPARRLAWTVVLVVAVGVALALDIGGLRKRLVDTSGGPRIDSLAVLPLENLSGDADQEYFAAGTHEALVTKLAGISALRVVARASVLRYKGTEKAAAEIAKELDVDAVLTGSVARSGDRVRITAQLIDATTEGHVWAETYERSLRDVLSLQNEIVAAITGEIRLQLTPQEQAQLSRTRPVNPEAYEAYLRGMFQVNQLTPEGVKKGLALLHEAVAKDPAHPLPYAQLAIGYATLGHGPSPPPDAFARARTAALQALTLDDTVAQAHEVLAELIMYDERTWDWPAAERAFQRALELNPALAQAHAHYGWYLVLFDRTDEALASVRRAQEVDPLTPLWPAMQALMYAETDYDEALREAQKALELNPTFPLALHALGMAYAGKGLYEQALAAHEQAGALVPGFRWGVAYTYALMGRREDALRIATELAPTRVNTMNLARIYAVLGDRDEAFRWLEAAYDQRHGNLPWIRNYSVLAPLRDDPRFAELVRRMNLPL